MKGVKIMSIQVFRLEDGLRITCSGKESLFHDSDFMRDFEKVFRLFSDELEKCIFYFEERSDIGG